MIGGPLAWLCAASMIGRPLARREDARILLGHTAYIDDISHPGALHAAFVRSPFAHATVLGCSWPDDADGVVLTAADLADVVVSAFPLNVPEGAWLASQEAHPVLPTESVRYVGQAVAAVLAESREAAEDVADLVIVDYEPLDPVLSARSSPVALERWARSSGDVSGAFASAAFVVRGSYALPRLAAVPLEPRGAIALYDADEDLLTVWLSAQDPHRPRAQLAHILGRPSERVRVVVPDVGGAFGSKGTIAPEVAIVAAAAIKLGRPVRWTEDRLENFLTANQGRGIEGELELALDARGRMLAIRARLYADLGGYLLTNTGVPGHTAAMLMTGCYDIPCADVSLLGALTHKVPTGPYRGAGRPDAAYMLERLVDQAALELGIDRVELRRRNLVRRFPHRTPLGYEYDSGDFERCLTRAVALLAGRGRVSANDGSVAGTGVALFVERAGGQWEGAAVSLEASGSFVVAPSANPHGQGHDTTFAQIAAERLGVPLDAIAMSFGDSAIVPPGVGTFGSRSVAMAGSAVSMACERLIELGAGVAADLLGVEVDAVRFSDGVFVSGPRPRAQAQAGPSRAGPSRAGHRGRGAGERRRRLGGDRLCERQFAAGSDRALRISTGVLVGRLRRPRFDLAGDRRAPGARSGRGGRRRQRDQPAARPRPGARRRRAGARGVARRGGPVRLGRSEPERLVPHLSAADGGRDSADRDGGGRQPDTAQPAGREGRRGGRRRRHAGGGRERGLRRARWSPPGSAVHRGEALAGVAGTTPVKPAPFAYEKPGSLDEALSLLLLPGATPLAGGQSLVPLMNFRFARPSMVIDLNGVRSLESVSVGDDGSLVLGALTRQALIERSPLVGERCPLLAQACRLIGHAAIRSRGTIGGSVAHAALGAELPVALLALDGIVVLRSLERGSRRVPAREFFRGPMMTSRSSDELIVSVEVPYLGPGARTAFTEYARTHGDFAVAGAAVVLAGRTAGSIALLGAGYTPVRAPESASEALVSGAGAAVVGELAAAEVGDDYRRALLSSLVARAVEEARGPA